MACALGSMTFAAVPLVEDPFALIGAAPLSGNAPSLNVAVASKVGMSLLIVEGSIRVQTSDRRPGDKRK